MSTFGVLHRLTWLAFSVLLTSCASSPPQQLQEVPRAPSESAPPHAPPSDVTAPVEVDEAGKPVTILPEGATQPKLIASGVTEADYPEQARAAGIEGEVIVKVVVSSTGSARIWRFIKSDPVFDDSVRSLVARMRFQPATLGGETIAVFQLLRFPFKLDE